MLKNNSPAPSILLSISTISPHQKKSADIVSMPLLQINLRCNFNYHGDEKGQRNNGSKKNNGCNNEEI